MRVLALDLGERRIGVALSDSRGVLASPYGVIERSGDDDDRSRIASLVRETGAERVLVGLPISLDGRHRAAARAASEEAARLAAHLTVPVETWDERLTTVEASRRRRERTESGGRGRGRGARGKLGRAGIDAEAAAVMLEAWLAAKGSEAP